MTSRRLVSNRITPTGIVILIALAWLFVVAFPTLRLFWQHDWAVIRFPYPVDYGEGPLLDQTLRLARFENIYRGDLSRLPYTIANYPPLFVLAQVPFAWAFGPAFWYGRAISFLAVVVAALSIGWTVATLTERRIAGIVGGALLLLSPYILHWSALNRIDSLALGLSCAGLAVLSSGHHRARLRLLAAGLLLAAVFTRQSYGLAAPAAAFLFLWREQGRAVALRFALGTAGAGLVLAGLLTLLTGGGFFFNIVTANINPFQWSTVRRYQSEIGDYFLVSAACAGLYLVGGWYRGRAWWMIAPYIVGATVSAITIGKAGSNVNYLFELAAAFGLAGGALTGWLSARLPLAALIPIGALAMQTMGAAPLFERDRYASILNKIDAQTEIEQLAAAVRSTDGPVLADEYMGLIPLAGQDLVFQPFEMKQLATAGIWDDTAMADRLEQREFPLILLYEPSSWDSRNERWTPLELLAISQQYERMATYAETGVYMPRR